MSGTNDQPLTEEECQKHYGCTLAEMGDQLEWLSYVQFRVKALTSEDISIAGICIVVEEFGKRIRELENQT